MAFLKADVVRGVRQQLDLPQALEQRDEVLLVARQLVCLRFPLVAELQVLVPRGEEPLALAQQLRHPWRRVLALQV